ncbi:ABC transporter permease [Roseospira marina]|uniref:ABC transporter permease n=1 Tax=Roseospira marina TaxID=140057 RepID=A0A5M6IHX8_9PROT|nr:ABC transporter permease [Roseospira marina]KAA5607567.1 ABC transporter permease [Roseospira marina]MBB4312244.1 NitT/TauT family transport system permease protein [Roseospira marina]MBB5085740.1 NitT/TauT family transport system permease protein [Roseospira marina]
MTRLVNRHPDRPTRLLLAMLPFALLIAAYAIGSDMRLAENPNDKLLPSFTALGDAITRMAFTPDKRTGDYLLWVDTVASLTRIAGGVAIATVFGLLVGVSVGLLPYARATLGGFLSAVAMIPPLAILPILFILFGLGELSKFVLVFAGIGPFIARDIAMRVAELPTEQIVKAQTLGASTWQICTRVVLPQMWPRLMDSVRLSLGAAWLFLIAAEAVASQDGLGYRIFLVRRYLAMDVILPYVAWITLLAFSFDWLLRVLQARLFPWFAPEGASR